MRYRNMNQQQQRRVNNQVQSGNYGGGMAGRVAQRRGGQINTLPQPAPAPQPAPVQQAPAPQPMQPPAMDQKRPQMPMGRKPPMPYAQASAQLDQQQTFKPQAQPYNPRQEFQQQQMAGWGQKPQMAGPQPYPQKQPGMFQQQQPMQADQRAQMAGQAVDQMSARMKQPQQFNPMQKPMGYQGY